MSENTNAQPKKKMATWKKVLIGVGGAFFLFILFAILSPGDDYEPEIEPDPEPGKIVVEVDDDETVPDTLSIALIEAVTETTDEDGNTQYIYDKDGTNLTITEVDAEEAEAAKEDAESVVSGESEGNEYTAVTKDGKTDIYMNVGATVAKAEVNSQGDGKTVEKTAQTVSAISSSSNSASSKNAWNYDSETLYLEDAHCILYYPAQLSRKDKSGKNNYLLSDKNSTATMFVTISKNGYGSMDDLEAFIEDSPDCEVLATGPDWITYESYANDNVVFTYEGFGSKYIVEAELVYPQKLRSVYDELSKRVKTKFEGDGVWEGAAGSYKNQNFSREMESYFDYDRDLFFVYPALFTQRTSTQSEVWFTDPRTKATIRYFEDLKGASIGDFDEYYSYDESWVIGERSMVAYYSEADKDNYMYVYDNEGGGLVIAEYTFSKKDEWVYREFVDKTRIYPAEGEPEMEFYTTYYSQYGLFVTVPKRFITAGEYDNYIYYYDTMNGFETSIQVVEATNADRQSIFNAFNIMGKDEDIKIFDYEARWQTDDAFYMGAVGNETKALFRCEYPNAEAAYGKDFNKFRMYYNDKPDADFAQLKNEVKTAEKIAELQKPIDDGKPKNPLVYKSYEDYVTMLTGVEEWFNSPGLLEDESYYYAHRNAIVGTMVSVLKYNNYDISPFLNEASSTGGLDLIVYQLEDEMKWMQMWEKDAPDNATSDLGYGKASAFEEMCKLYNFDKPTYVTGQYKIATKHYSDTNNAGKQQASTQGTTTSSTSTATSTSEKPSGNVADEYEEYLEEIVARTGTETVYEEIAAEIIGVFGDPSYYNDKYVEQYGNLSDFYIPEESWYKIDDFVANLEKNGVTYELTVSDGGYPIDLYTGYLKGYEEYGKAYVALAKDNSRWVMWTFEKYYDMPYEKGKRHLDEGADQAYLIQLVWDGTMLDNPNIMDRASMWTRYAQELAMQNYSDPLEYCYAFDLYRYYVEEYDAYSLRLGVKVCKVGSDGKPTVVDYYWYDYLGGNQGDMLERVDE